MWQYFVFVVVVLFGQSCTQDNGPYVQNNQDNVPKYLQNRYNSFGNANTASQPGTKTSFTKTKTKSKTKTASSGRLTSVCKDKPQAPPNSGLMCSKYSGCKATCKPNYQFPNGKTDIFISCIDGKWTVSTTEWDTIPGCEPICLPECQNNGICVSPNQCHCSENFSGPQCQYQQKPCLNLPPIPINSKRMCRAKTCTVTCIDGHKFPDGSSITTMTCKDGEWVPAKEKWSYIPDCKATCDPPCQNGGVCLSYNVCQCPRDYRGPQCQYMASRCSAQTLQFNGNFNCSSDAESFSCNLRCPQGVSFDFTPALLYTCKFETGTFVPKPIPQCLYGSDYNVIPTGDSKHFFSPGHNNGASNHKLNGVPIQRPNENDPSAYGENINIVPLGYHGALPTINTWLWKNGPLRPAFV